MGCFSYICDNCGKSIRENEAVKLFVLQGNKVLEEMEGNYSLYGKVNDKEWTNDWGAICNLHFNNHSCDGIAAIHSECWNGEVPTEYSVDDEHQGCGKQLRKSTSVCTHVFNGMIEESVRDVEDNKKWENMSNGLSNLLEETRKILDELREHNKGK